MWAMQFSPFQSTLPARGATCATSTCPQISQFQSTLPARERRPVCDRVWALPDISIHAPRTGSDLRSAGRRPLLDLFSIHAPRTGSDSVILNEVGQILIFNPRSPHGGATECLVLRLDFVGISIHAPRTGGATLRLLATPDPPQSISIHAPRTGSDGCPLHPRFRYPRNFNPRSPHGERRCRTPTGADRFPFSIHAPARGATKRRSLNRHSSIPFSIHASPHGERRKGRSSLHRRICISIHAPRTGSDNSDTETAINTGISIHAPRTGSDTNFAPTWDKPRHFNPRSPHGERRMPRRR